jgi:hypothetical protein
MLHEPISRRTTAEQLEDLIAIGNRIARSLEDLAGQAFNMYGPGPNDPPPEPSPPPPPSDPGPIEGG